MGSSDDQKRLSPESNRTSYDSSKDVPRGRSYSSDAEGIMPNTSRKPAEAAPAARKPSSVHYNGHTTCGRHSQQFLFEGPGLMDLVREVLRKE